MKLVRTLPALALLALTLPAFAFSHRLLDQVLRHHVRAGRVDYAAIKEKALPELERYLEAVAQAEPAKMGRDARLAFYLNAYNALVLKAVADRWPDVKSVLKVKGFFDRLRYSVGGRKVTLNQLENEIIRPEFRDPRIHFALVCAARSCPPLQRRAFRAGSLDKVLTRLARRFINSRRGVRAGEDGFRVSKLFRWYAKDFEQAAGSVGAYLARYHRKRADALREAKDLGYLPYNWSLNKR